MNCRTIAKICQWHRCWESGSKHVKQFCLILFQRYWTGPCRPSAAQSSRPPCVPGLSEPCACRGCPQCTPDFFSFRRCFHSPNRCRQSSLSLPGSRRDTSKVCTSFHVLCRILDHFVKKVKCRQPPNLKTIFYIGYLTNYVTVTFLCICYQLSLLCTDSC